MLNTEAVKKKKKETTEAFVSSDDFALEQTPVC